MKKFIFISLIVIVFIYVLIPVKAPPAKQNIENVSQEEFTSNHSSRKNSNPLNRKPTSSKEDRDAYANTFLKNLPSSLNKNAWSHEIVFEDNRFVSTQLKYSNKNVDTYFYRWKKDSQNNISLAAGLVPTPSGVAGKFSDTATKEKFISNLKGTNKSSDLLLLGNTEVWEMGYDNLLHPRIRVEVEYKKQGIIHHEHLYLDSATGKITNRRSLDRH